MDQEQTLEGAAIPTAVENHKRFGFGENWTRFIQFVDGDRIKAAEDSLTAFLGDIHGKTFLDIGSGSGLFSLAARNHGAHVHSFDFDRQSVACTKELKRRYRPGDSDWTIEWGDVLDQDYLANLGQFDVVYSWGVLHVTGNMWKAVENASRLVKPGGGFFYIALNHDQGGASRRWMWIKRTYNDSGPIGRWLLIGASAAYFEGQNLLAALLHGRNPFTRWQSERGMKHKTDLIDWVGGWPFEVATPDAVFEFCTPRGFILRRLKTRSGVGCNEFVFQKE